MAKERESRYCFILKKKVDFITEFYSAGLLAGGETAPEPISQECSNQMPCLQKRIDCKWARGSGASERDGFVQSTLS